MSITLLACAAAASAKSLQSCPTLCRRRVERSYSTFKIRRGDHKEIPLVQGKEQRLRFSGAAVKRYPTHVQGKRNPSNIVGVARGHQRANTLKP